MTVEDAKLLAQAFMETNTLVRKAIGDTMYVLS